MAVFHIYNALSKGNTIACSSLVDFVGVSDA